MSDEPTESDKAPETTPDEGTTPDEELGEQGKKALEAERAARKAAENDKKVRAAKVKELEDRDKTETEKAAERLSEAEKRATAVEARATRAEIAAATSVPTDILAGPESTSSEHIQAFAEKVIAYVTEASKKNPNGPVIPGQGKQPDKPAKENSDDWFRALIEH
jgi:predicted Zn-dependent protease